MALGPGKYDDECTRIRQSRQATSVIVIVFGGDRGPGFSAQVSPTVLLDMPRILRDVADQIERSGMHV